MSETRLAHFELPPQWATMREANLLERTTGRRIIHLEKGDFASPEFKPPREAVEALSASLREGFVRYSPGPGTWPLREALAEEMTRRGRPTTAEEIIVTPGAKFGITASFLLFLNDGDEVIMPNPGYPPDEFWARYLRASIKYVGFRDSRHVDTAQLEDLITPRTRLVVFNTPQRPNGQLIENTDEIAAVLERHPQVTVVSDEIFSQLVYPPYHHTSLAEYPALRDRTIVIDTFSNGNAASVGTNPRSPHRRFGLRQPQKEKGAVDRSLQVPKSRQVVQIVAFDPLRIAATMRSCWRYCSSRIAMSDTSWHTLPSRPRAIPLRSPAPPPLHYFLGRIAAVPGR